MGMSQICAGAGDYFRPSKPHSVTSTCFAICSFIHTSILFLDFNCPPGKRATKKTIKIGAGESVMYNTNPDGADK